jgi:hypothetical protein
LAISFFTQRGSQIDEVTAAAAEVRQMLDGETEPARAGRADHDPVAALGEKFVTQLSENCS